MSGTSMAGPHVAGLVALLMSANPSLAGNIDLVEDIIEQTAVTVTVNPPQVCGGISSNTIPNNTYGWGRIDAFAAYQEAIVDVLVRQAFAAVERAGESALAVVGGVSANSRLRTRLTERAVKEGIELGLPALSYCTDNAAMIAAAGQRALLQGNVASLDCEAMPDCALPVWSGSGAVRRTS